MESTVPRGTQPSADWLGARAGRGSLLLAAGCFPARAGAQAAPARQGLAAWREKKQGALPISKRQALASSNLVNEASVRQLASQPDSRVEIACFLFTLGGPGQLEASAANVITTGQVSSTCKHLDR